MKKFILVFCCITLLNGCAFINEVQHLNCLKTIMKTSAQFGYEQITVGLNRYDALPEDLLKSPDARPTILSFAVWKKSDDEFHYIGYTILEKNGQRDDVLSKEVKLIEAGAVYVDFGEPDEHVHLLKLLNENQVDHIVVRFVEGDVILKSSN